jgi:hypothetical protein
VKTFLFIILLLFPLSASAQFNGCNGGFCPGLASGSAPVGPPTFTFVSAGIESSGTTKNPVYTASLGSSGPYFLGLTFNSLGTPGSVSSITATATTGTVACSSDAVGLNATTSTAGVGHCTTSAASPGTVTITINYASDPFTSTVLGYWTAITSTFTSTTPTSPVGQNTATSTTVSSTSGASSGGTCLMANTNDANVAAPTLATTGSTFTYSQQYIGDAFSMDYWGGNATASSTTTATNTAVWGSPPGSGHIAQAVACWR